MTAVATPTGPMVAISGVAETRLPCTEGRAVSQCAFNMWISIGQAVRGHGGGVGCGGSVRQSAGVATPTGVMVAISGVAKAGLLWTEEEGWEIEKSLALYHSIVGASHAPRNWKVYCTDAAD